MEKVRKITSLFLSLALLLALMPGMARAAETEEVTEDASVAEEAAETTENEPITVSEEGIATVSSSGNSGTCGANLTWTLSSDGSKLTISGTGAMYSYDGKTPPWGSAYNNGIETVVIGNSVTSIGAGAFNCFFDLTSVTIGSSVKSIGNYSFVGCISLESIVIPRSVTSIADEAFDDCISIFYGYRDTAAETYAKTHGITFIPLDIAYPTMSSIANTSNGVKITWSAVSGATKYNIYRKVSGESSWTKVGTSTTNSYTCTGLTSGKTYIFTVQAVTSSGSSSYGSSTKTIVWLSQPSVSVSNASAGVKVSWNKVTGATGYWVYRKTSGGSYSKIATISSGSTVSYTDKTASSGTTYYYTVRACNGNVGSSYASKTIVYLAQPTVTLSNASTGVKVSWNKVTGASGYYVYRKTSGGTFSKIATITSVSTVAYTDTAVKSKSGTTYYYTVRAYKGSTLSSYVTNKTIVRLTQPTVTVANASAGVKVSWNKVTGATGYWVYRKTSGGSYSKIATISSGSTVSYTDKTANSGTTYYYTVRACNGNVGSSYASKSIVYLAQPTVTLSNASTGVKVSWSKVTGASGYYVYRKTSGGTFSKIATVTGGSTVSYTDKTAKSGTTYYYTVRACKGSTLSGYVTDKSITR